jgi:hypothetical protein
MPCLGCESSIFVALPRMNWSPQAFRIEATAKAAFHGLSALHPEPLALRLASSLAAPAKPVELHAMAGVQLLKVLSLAPRLPLPTPPIALLRRRSGRSFHQPTRTCSSRTSYRCRSPTRSSPSQRRSATPYPSSPPHCSQKTPGWSCSPSSSLQPNHRLIVDEL